MFILESIINFVLCCEGTHLNLILRRLKVALAHVCSSLLLGRCFRIKTERTLPREPWWQVAVLSQLRGTFIWCDMVSVVGTTCSRAVGDDSEAVGGTPMIKPLPGDRGSRCRDSHCLYIFNGIVGCQFPLSRVGGCC